MLEIRNVQMLPDGRSFVETWGTWRFRIMDRGMRDGYMVARVERIEDYEEEMDGPLPPEERAEGGGAGASAEDCLPGSWRHAVRGAFARCRTLRTQYDLHESAATHSTSTSWWFLFSAKDAPSRSPKL